MNIKDKYTTNNEEPQKKKISEDAMAVCEVLEEIKNVLRIR